MSTVSLVTASFGLRFSWCRVWGCRGFRPAFPLLEEMEDVINYRHVAGEDVSTWPVKAGDSNATELEDALRAAFGHDGPALVNIHTARQELALPPKLTYGQLKGFTLYATRTILSGGGEELVELTKTNLRELAVG